jgi:hypothetical protein
MNAPVNSKSLFAFICDQMEKLDKEQVSLENVKEQANLVQKATNLLKYELDRANTQIRIRDFNVKTGATLAIREVEAKGFTDTTSNL